MLQKIWNVISCSLFICGLFLCFVNAIKISFSEIKGGIIGIYNQILHSLGRTFGQIMPILVKNTDMSQYISIFVLAIVCGVVCAVALMGYIYKRPLVHIIFATLVIVFACIVNSIDEFSVLLLLVGIITSFMNVITISNSTSRQSFEVRLSALIICGGILLCSLFFPRQLPILEKTKESVAEKAEVIRYGKGYVLPQGDFSKIKNFEPSDTPQLEIVMSNPDSYYLRGFVGETYTGNGWSNLDKEKLYENSDLFYWLHKKEFYGQTQLSLLSSLLEKTETDNNIIVNNISANPKYIYAPYEISAGESLLPKEKIGDVSLFQNSLFGNKNYSYTASENQVKQYTTLAAGLYEKEKEKDSKLNKYLNNEAHYNEFVYDNYLEISDSVYNLFKNILGEYKIDETHFDYGKAKQNILNYMMTNITYSIEAEPAKRDFVSTFLQETHSGYSVHFATAATLMFRYYGIPARYVEGYLITPEKVAGVLSNSVITLYEKDAHAWTEFYQDGVGWIPFETTPQYLDIMEKAEDLTGVDIPSYSNKDSFDEPENSKKDDSNKEQGMENIIKQNANCIVAVLLVILLILIIAFCIWQIALLLIRRKRLQKLKATFEVTDTNLAIQNLFAHSVELLVRLGALESTNAAYYGSGMVEEILGNNYSKLFKESLIIYERAMFGTTKTDKEFIDILKKLEEETVLLIKNNSGRINGLVEQYILYLY